MFNRKKIKDLEFRVSVLEDVVFAILDELKLDLDFCEECGEAVLTKIKK